MVSEKTLGAYEMLIEIINKAIQKPPYKAKKKATPAFKPSALGTKCPRKLYYSYNKVEQDFYADLQLQTYGNLGNDAHERISRYIRESGVLIDYYNEKGKSVTRFGSKCLEFPLVDPDLDIKLALIDAVMIIDNKLWLGEWKTIGLKGFNNLVMPKDDHLVQGSTYLYSFMRALSEGAYSHIKELEGFTKVEGIRFLYECRDNGQFKEFGVTEASQVFRHTLAKMGLVKDCTQNGTIPPKVPDWCRSCEWRTKCSKDFKV